MKKIAFFFVIVFVAMVSTEANAQFTRDLGKSLKAPKDFDQVHSEIIYSDPFGTNTVLFIKEGVPSHVHRVHTETIYVIEGKGYMRVGIKKIDLRPGVVVVVPPTVVHSAVVTSGKPLKVITFHTPEYKGEDMELR
ncbi:MAG: mannose-6-phosphate isomerase-like protein (cupin superfamily) [Sphingobacteriales bacterium]|jgi:mannose-6-phosphate isomerase-like protein (cupin superfamily)